jgi:hypothetical protein
LFIIALQLFDPAIAFDAMPTRARFHLYVLEFDGTVGPQIIESIGPAHLTDDQTAVLKSCAFPECATPRSSIPPIFAFSLDDSFCYCLFNSTPDPDAPRGHRLTSYVVSTSLPYFPLFFRLLHSVLSITKYNPVELVRIMADFIQKWNIDSLVADADVFEVPMLDGSFPIAYTKSTDQLLSFTMNHAVPHSRSPYFVNDHFLGCDLPTVLGLRNLKENDCLGDLLALWEAVFLGESILVYGATPSTASLAAFAIRSFVFPRRLAPPLHPFISITDPRFQGIVASPIGIVGVSNPMALQMAANFQNVFIVGFAEGGGLGKGRRPWPAFAGTSMGTAELRTLLYQNTTRLVAAMRDTLAAGACGGTSEIQTASTLLENKIAERGIELARPAKQFAAQLAQTRCFKSFGQAPIRRSQSV